MHCAKEPVSKPIHYPKFNMGVEGVLQGTFKEKEEQRRSQRNQVRDNNRQNITNSFSSPEYELLKKNKSSGLKDDENFLYDSVSTMFLKPRRLNDSLEHVKQRENWMYQQQHARNNRFVKNRQDMLETNSLNESHMELDLGIEQNPKKDLIRNFIMSNYSEVERISDIYVNSSQLPVIKTPEHSSLIQLRYFVLGFVFAFFFLSVALKRP
jgi:hypothetical protein